MTAVAEQPVWRPIMDGKTLTGWHKNGLGDWKVQDGAFVGRSNKEKLYGHLVSDGQYRDFTVRFKFQCTSGDSGFFIRTEMEEPDKTHGLQIQVGPFKSGNGGIYESYGRGWLQEPTDQQELCFYRNGQWNEMIISAHGPRVTVHVNGYKTADLNDKKIRQKAGVLALQMHSGVVNHTRFKDIALLKKGKIVPRAFLYDDVAPVQPAADGTLKLDAAAALSVGPSITYQPDWHVMGSITNKDHLIWKMHVKQAGRYAVSIEWSADEQAVGLPFVLEVGRKQLAGETASTGSVQAFDTAEIGQLRLPAGLQEAKLKLRGSFPGTVPLHLRRLTLVPLD
jgi:hypothetical protein